MWILCLQYCVENYLKNSIESANFVFYAINLIRISLQNPFIVVSSLQMCAFSTNLMRAAS